MRIAFRTDASSQIGTGHVVRCLTLADALRERGAECEFVCREHEANLIGHVRSRGYEVHALPKPEASVKVASSLAHSRWLGIDWQTDAAQTRQALGGEALDWLIVDHYALDHHWESVMRSACKRMMAIDDLADRRHDCDLLLDQNYGSSTERYRGLVPADSSQCHGPEYALLKPVYAERCAQLSARDGQVRRVLIYFGGGADEANLTSMAVEAFQASELAHIELDIVIGAAYAHQSSLEALVAHRGKATIHRQLPDLANLMAAADLAIGAGGVTTWERCCLGLPSIVIGTAVNQLAACEALAAEDAIKYLGHLNGVTSDTLTRAIIHLLSVPEQLDLYSRNCRRLVDGRGASRVIEYLCVQD